MKRWMIFIVLTLLFIGIALFRMINSETDFTPAREDFRTWFWEYRILDIAVQILLIFGGALGIAAILPFGDENDD